MQPIGGRRAAQTGGHRWRLLHAVRGRDVTGFIRLDSASRSLPEPRRRAARCRRLRQRLLVATPQHAGDEAGGRRRRPRRGAPWELVAAGSRLVAIGPSDACEPESRAGRSHSVQHSAGSGGFAIAGRAATHPAMVGRDRRKPGRGAANGQRNYALGAQALGCETTHEVLRLVARDGALELHRVVARLGHVCAHGCM